MRAGGLVYESVLFSFFDFITCILPNSVFAADIFLDPPKESGNGSANTGVWHKIRQNLSRHLLQNNLKGGIDL